MVLGRSRVKTLPAFPRALSSPPPDWRFTSSAPIYETQVDLTGAFPGYVERGARLENARLCLYDHALVIEEGRTHGFYLALDRVIATDEDELDPGNDQSVRVRYRDGADSRLFSVRPRAGRLTLRGGGRRTNRLLTELHALGVPGGPVDDIPIDAFLTLWSETDSFGQETMVWHGHAAASLLLTGERISCDVFITSKSLVWGKDARSPISRVPLHAIRDVTPGHGGPRAQHPAAFIGIGDGEFDRVEFSFVFDTYESTDRNALERSAFIVHLRSRPVPLAYPQPPDQPWMRASQPDPIAIPVWPSSTTAVRGPRPVAHLTAVRDDDREFAPPLPAFRDPAERLRPDRGVLTAHDWMSPGDTVSAWPEAVLPLAGVVDGAAVEEPIAPQDRMLSEWAPPESKPAAREETGQIRVIGPVPIRETPSDPIRAYEAEALDALSEILDVVRRRERGDRQAAVTRRPPTVAALSAAIEALVDRTGRGALVTDAATAHKERLLAIDDAARRLDAILPLHANGAISIRELRARADALCAELSASLFAGSR